MLSKKGREKLTEAAKDRLDKLWASSDQQGPWVRHEDLPDVDADTLYESGLIEDDRRDAELRNGSAPTADEIKKYLECWLESYFEDPCDVDIPTYALAHLKDEEGNQGVALILRTGFSFHGVDEWLEGVFSSERSAIRWMKKGGYCC